MARKKMLDMTQWETVYAILEGIKANAEAADFKACGRMAHAAQMIMTDLPVEDERK